MIRKFFKKKSKDHKKYDPDLITKFHEDHKKLLKLYGDILESYDSKNQEKLYGYVKKLKTFFIYHLYEEDQKLYSFLAKNKESDKINEEVFQEMHTEISVIKEVVLKFLKEYNNILDEMPGPKFKEDFEKIGVVLVHRIDLEEEILYSMYSKDH